MVIPGQGFPTEDDDSITSAEGSSSSSTTRTTPTLLSLADADADADDTPRNNAHLSSGAIAAIAIASVVFALILSSVIFLLSRHSRILRALEHRRPSVQTNNIQAGAKEVGNEYISPTLIPPHGGEIGYWTSYGLPAPAPNYRPTGVYYKYKSPTDFHSSSSASSPERSNGNSSPPLPPPLGIDQVHELPNSEPKERGGFKVDWSAYDERLSPSSELVWYRPVSVENPQRHTSHWNLATVSPIHGRVFSQIGCYAYELSRGPSYRG